MSSAKQFESVIQAWLDLTWSRNNEALMRFLKKRELNHAQYGVLMRLYHKGDCAISDIGKHFDVTTAAASQLVDRMVKEGLVERTESLQDRRMKQLALTSQGRALVRASLSARLDWTRDLADKLSPEQRDDITRSLAELIRVSQTLETAQA